MKKIDDYFRRNRSHQLDLVNLEKIERVLDVGCGSGGSAKYLKKKKKITVVGVEPEFAMQVNEMDEVFHCTAEKFIDDYNGANFDLILCLDVLEHIWDYERVLLQLKEKLNTGGLMLISVPNVSNFRVFFQIFILGNFPRAQEGIFDETHCRWFTKKVLKEDIVNAGLTPILFGYSGMEKFKVLFFLNLITFGLFRRFLGFQVLVLCKN